MTDPLRFATVASKRGRAGRRARLVAASLFGAVVVHGPAFADGAGALRAMQNGDCQGAGSEINEGLARNEGRAYFAAGYLYDMTGCVEPDPPRAERLYRRAIELGDKDAPRFLGLMYGLGRGVPQDYVKAAEAFRSLRKPDAGDTLTREQLRAAGYGSTVSNRAASKINYPTDAGDVRFNVTLDLVKREATFSRANGVQASVQTAQSFIDKLTRAYAAAFNEAPIPDPPLKPPALYSVPFSFKLE